MKRLKNKTSHLYTAAFIKHGAGSCEKKEAEEPFFNVQQLMCYLFTIKTRPIKLAVCLIQLNVIKIQRDPFVKVKPKPFGIRAKKMFS